MSKTLYSFLAAALMAGGAPAATLELDGPVTLAADLSNSPTSALAIGPGARAEASVNVIEGSVKTKAVTMTANLKNSPTSALAIGPGAVAKARVNAIVGK